MSLDYFNGMHCNVCSRTPSASYLYLLLVHFHTEVTLCSWPASQVNQRCVLYMEEEEDRSAWFLWDRAEGTFTAHVLTPVLSIAWRTADSELSEDNVGEVCLYNSRVDKASSLLTSASNTIPFSSTAQSHTLNWPPAYPQVPTGCVTLEGGKKWRKP